VEASSAQIAAATFSSAPLVQPWCVAARCTGTRATNRLLGNCCGSILLYIALYCSILLYIAIYCSILLYIALYCSILIDHIRIIERMDNKDYLRCASTKHALQQLTQMCLFLGRLHSDVYTKNAQTNTPRMPRIKHRQCPKIHTATLLDIMPRAPQSFSVFDILAIFSSTAAEEPAPRHSSSRVRPWP